MTDQVRVLLCLFAVMCSPGIADERESLILSYKQYAKINHEVPYVLEFEVGNGALLIYGGRHVFDPVDAQIADIQKEWERFKPDVAYNEGGNPPTAGSVTTAVEQFGEPGLVRFLSGQKNVPVATFEPRLSDEIDALKKRYSSEELAVFYALRAYLTFRSSKQTKSAEEYMSEIIGGRFATDNGLENAPENLAEFEAACGRVFVGLSDWRKVPENWFDPTQEGQFTNELQNDSGIFRDRHIFGVLTKRARRGDRVLAVIGASHVPVLEPALVAEFGKPSRKRDGERLVVP